MISSVLRLSRRAVGAACCSCFFFSFGVAARTLLKQGPPAQSSAKESREPGPPQRIPRQQAQNTAALDGFVLRLDRKSTRLNSSHGYISYAVFCLKKNIITQY